MVRKESNRSEEANSNETPYAPNTKPASSGVAEESIDQRSARTKLRIVTSSRPPDEDCLPSETAAKGAVEAEVEEQSNSDNDQPLARSKRRNIVPEVEEESDSDDDQPLINSRRRNAVSGGASQLDADNTSHCSRLMPLALWLLHLSSAPVRPSTKTKKTTPTPTPKRSVNANGRPEGRFPSKQHPQTPPVKSHRQAGQACSQD